MLNRILAYALSMLLLPTAAWAHRCGLPYQLKLSKGTTVEYAITGDHSADYVVIGTGDKDVATIEPTKINQQEDGQFKIMAVGKGTTEFNIEWQGITRSARCNVVVSVTE